MNPDAVVSTYPIDEPSATGGRDVYIIVEVLADGRIRETKFRRGTAGPGGQDQAVGSPTITGTDENQKKTWDQQQKAAEAKATPPGGRPTTIVQTPQGPRIYEYDPQTGQYGRDLGPAQPASPRTPEDIAGDQRKEREAQTLENERIWNRQNGGLYETHAERRVREAREREANQPKPSPVVSQRTVKDETTGKTVTINTHADGTETRSETQVVEKKEPPKPQQGPDGQWGYWDTSGAQPVWKPIAGPTAGAKTSAPTQVDGEWGVWTQETPGAPPVWTPVQGPGGAGDKPAVQRITGGWRPDPAQPGFGLFDLQARLLEAVARGEITNADARAALARMQPLAQAEIDRITGIEGTQRSVFNTNVTQRGQDLNDIQGRRSAAGGALNNAFGYAQRFKLGPAHIRYLTEMQQAQIGQWGGLRDVPREQPYPMTQGILGIGLNGRDGQQAGGPTPAGPSSSPPAGYAPRGVWAQGLPGGPMPATVAPAPLPGIGGGYFDEIRRLAPPVQPTSTSIDQLAPPVQGAEGAPPQWVDPIEEVLAMSPLAGGY